MRTELTCGPEDLARVGGTLCLRGGGRGVVAQLEAALHLEPLGPELVALHRLHTLKLIIMGRNAKRW